MHARLLLLALAAFAAAAPAGAAPATLRVSGETGETKTLSAEDLDALPQASASITHDGKTYRFKGALLSEVLKTVDAPLGAAMRGAAL